MKGPYYLEDFAVGQIFKTGRLRIDKEQIFAFAKQFDPQPYHLDEAAALKSPFQGLAASGWHTAALTMRLLAARSAARRRASCAERSARRAALEIPARSRHDPRAHDDIQSKQRDRADLYRQSLGATPLGQYLVGKGRHGLPAASVDRVESASEMPNFPRPELDKIGDFALAKIREAMLAVTGR